MKEFATNSEKDFSLVYFLSTNIVLRNVCYVENGASLHMTSSSKLFSSFKEEDSRVHVDLGDDAKYLVA